MKEHYLALAHQSQRFAFNWEIQRQRLLAHGRRGAADCADVIAHTHALDAEAYYKLALSAQWGQE